MAKRYRSKTRASVERRKQRYTNTLARVYFDQEHAAGYFLGEIPSVNELTLDVHKLKRRAPTAQVKIFYRTVINWLKQYASRAPSFKYFDLDIAVFVNCYTGQAVIMRDASNFIKIAEDSICKALGTDDRFNFDVAVHKRNLPAGQVPHWTFVLTGRNHEQHEKEGGFKSIWWKEEADKGKGEAVKEVERQAKKQTRRVLAGRKRN